MSSWRRALNVLSLAWAVFGAPAPSRAQLAQPVRRPSAAHTVVSLLVVSSGSTFDEFFGHLALRVRDSTTGRDFTYNWGTYRQHGLGLAKAVAERRVLSYFVLVPTRLLVEGYAQQGRSVTEYSLPLDDDATWRLEAGLARAATDSVHVYDYLLDNCATPIRDLLGRALGQDFLDFGARKTQRTYRSELATYIDPHLGYALAISLMLGRGAERPLSEWEAMFLPQSVADGLVAFDSTRQHRNGGVARRVLVSPAVRRESVRWPASALVAIAALVLAAGAIAVRQGWRMIATIVVTIPLVFFGTLGTIATLMWFATDHWIAAGNVRLLAYSPCLLLLATLTFGGSRRVTSVIFAVLVAAAVSGTVAALAERYSGRALADCVASFLMLLSWGTVHYGLLRRRVVPVAHEVMIRPPRHDDEGVGISSVQSSMTSSA